MLQTGEAAIFPLTPMAVAALKEKGIFVAHAPPREGSVVLTVGQRVITNARLAFEGSRWPPPYATETKD